ncbi:hypothetical protein KSP39_PZI011486 [Platanthera zijinensis]|uniref:Uncharacterized protein n=1 Tax=Platanthera zijinensis TaxID=2320716 RepID=A0AAP0G5Z3_9ASPA
MELKFSSARTDDFVIKLGDQGISRIEGCDPHSHRQHSPEGRQKRKKTLDSCYSLRLIGGHQK